MSDHRRYGAHPNEFSREIRAVNGGGTIPPEWGCKVVDLDSLHLLVGAHLLEVTVAGHLWIYYEDPPLRLVAVIEYKTPHDAQQSWAVTKLVARKLNVAGFCALRRDDGSVTASRLDGTQESYRDVREFVEHEIRPLYDWAPF